LPQWQFAMSTYGFSDPETLVMASCENGIWQVQAMDINTGGLRLMPGGISSVSQLIAANGKALILGASPEQSLSVIEWDLESNRIRNIKPSAEMSLDSGWISKPQDLTFQGPEQSQVHSFYYPPTNPNFIAPGEERPPLIVIGHGGPTGATTGAFNLALQFWTSRGFAVLDVNYRGSTGYGRKYRALLDGQWGLADVQDCVAGAQTLVESDEVDPERLAIRGSSAGGFTTLAALAFHDVFRAGASYYGIGELEALARDTHKFESRYLDRLIGPYPESAALYQQRSPINHVQDLSCPVIFFQGLEDKVVPPNQALMMRDALREKGIPVACLLFESEQHGFRNAETIRQALQAELYFYGRVFGFNPADDLPEIEIENL
jgi:dipeptidyl aminopeptidase/acylaminoacyl peptidase